MAVTLDEAFEQIGSMGRYQIRLIAIFLFSAFFVIGFQTLLVTFIAAEPGWKCVGNSTACNLTGIHRPGTDHYNYRCDLARSDWEFTDEFTSAVTQWNLVCKSSILQSVSSSAIFAGWLLGALVLSWVSDKTGRRKVSYFGSVAIVVVALLSAASPYFWAFVLCRAVVGFFIGGTSLNHFILVTEFVGVRHRNVAGTIIWYAWTCSYMTTALIAYYVRDWKMLTLAVSISGIPCVFFWWFIPESARWLLVKGRVKEAESTVKEMAKFNNKMALGEPLVEPTTNKKNAASFLHLFRNKKMTHYTIVLWFAWAINTMVYYGVSLSSPALGGNIYINFFLTSIIEIPANSAAIFSMKWFGRKKSTVFPMILASLASIGAVLLTKETDDLGYIAGRIIMAMLAKFFIMISFDSIYVYSAELFPTVIRSIGMGTSSAAGRMGSFLSSYVVWLQRVHSLLPYGIMGSAAFVAGLLCLTLPETKDKPTSEVFDSSSAGEEMLDTHYSDEKPDNDEVSGDDIDCIKYTEPKGTQLV